LDSNDAPGLAVPMPRLPPVVRVIKFEPAPRKTKLLVPVPAGPMFHRSAPDQFIVIPVYPTSAPLLSLSPVIVSTVWPVEDKCNLLAGLAVPIPTSPLLLITKRSKALDSSKIRNSFVVLKV
jgi:hypothetical protein